MKTVYEEEEKTNGPSDAQTDPQPDRELTVSSSTLLALFFGLVLLCGFFFAFGYTLGRRAPADGAQPSSATPVDAQPLATQAKPSAAARSAAPASAPGNSEAPDSSEAASAPATSTTPDEAASSTTPTGAPESPLPAGSASPSRTPPAAASASPPAPGTPAAASKTAPPPSFLVQIAAVSNPADADVLVRALEKRGYSVTARNLPGDPLVHVQVGPFSSRADAVAMRQKLLADGYNAILK